MASVPTVWTALRSPRSERSGGFSPICPPAQAGGPHRRAGGLRALLALRPPAAWKREPLPGRIRKHVGPIRPGRTKEKPGRNPLPHPSAVPRHGNGFPLSALSSRGGICGPNFGSALEQFFSKSSKVLNMQAERLLDQEPLFQPVPAEPRCGGAGARMDREFWGI